jgi:AraC-like DNA-binding protein
VPSAGTVRRCECPNRSCRTCAVLETSSTGATPSRSIVRCFTEVYGTTPAAYLAERRIERAQDLLRATNLTVTEVCMLVGYSSLGSFSTKFRQLVGVSPSVYQGSFAATGAPHIPGCYVFMLGLHDRAVGQSGDSARTKKRRVAGQS